MYFITYCTSLSQHIPYEEGPFNTREEALEFANDLGEISKILGIVLEDCKNETFELLDFEVDC